MNIVNEIQPVLFITFRTFIGFPRSILISFLSFRIYCASCIAHVTSVIRETVISPIA